MPTPNGSHEPLSPHLTSRHLQLDASSGSQWGPFTTRVAFLWSCFVDLGPEELFVKAFLEPSRDRGAEVALDLVPRALDCGFVGKSVVRASVRE